MVYTRQPLAPAMIEGPLQVWRVGVDSTIDIIADDGYLDVVADWLCIHAGDVTAEQIAEYLAVRAAREHNIRVEQKHMAAEARAFWGDLS